MESIIWNGVKPFCKTEKGNLGIGYGYCKKCNTRGYHNFRKAYREIHKLGFDKSEIWSLDYTIARWLSDTYGGYFTMVGNFDNWYFIRDEIVDKSLGEKRFDNYLDYFEEIFKQDSKKISAFILPRLIILRKELHGYPTTAKSFEKWEEILDSIIESLKKNEWNPLLKEYFFNLWD